MILAKKNIIADILAFTCGLALISLIVLEWKTIRETGGDAAPVTYSLYGLVAESIDNNENALWNPYLWGGMTNIGNPISMASYPINILLCKILSHGDISYTGYWIVTIQLILHLQLFYYGVYIIASRLIKLPNLYAVLLSILSITNFCIYLYWNWSVSFYLYSYYPLIIYYTLRLLYAEEKYSLTRNFIILGIIYGMNALLSISQLLMVNVFLISILVIYIGVKRKQIICTLARFALSGLLGIVIALPSIVETFRFSASSVRFAHTEWVDVHTAVPIDVFHAHSLDSSFWPILFNVEPRQSFMSIGGFLLFFCVLGFGMRPKDDKSASLYKWSFIGTICCLLCSFDIVWMDILYYIPGINVLREAHMYSLYFLIFAVFMAGFGIKGLLEKKLEGIPVIVSILIILYIYNLVPHHFSRIKLAICCILGFIFIVNMLSKNQTISFVVSSMLAVVVAAFSILLFYRNLDVFNFMTHREVNENVRFVDTQNLTELRGMLTIADDDRIMTIGTSAYPNNQTEVLRIRDALGSHNPVPKRNQQLNDHVGFEKRSQLLNIKYYLISNQNNDDVIAWFDSFSWVSRMANTIKLFDSYNMNTKENETVVYETTNRNGSAWLVDNVGFVSYTDPNLVFEWINNPDTDLRINAIVDPESLLPEDKETLNKFMEMEPGRRMDASVTLTVTTPNKMTYHVNSDKEYLMVTSELYEEGWRVKINDIESRVINVNYFNRGVIVPPGESYVEFYYHPKGLSLFRFLQITAFIVCMIVLVLMPVIIRVKKFSFETKSHQESNNE